MQILGDLYFQNLSCEIKKKNSVCKLTDLLTTWLTKYIKTSLGTTVAKHLGWQYKSGGSCDWVMCHSGLHASTQ